jgi:ring-1,2-phenylacetyl-CoA epoxidase subunit PaaE
VKITFILDQQIKEIHNPEEGRTLLDLALIAGLAAPYDCMEGSCGTCEANVNGKLVRTCQTLPSSEENQTVNYNKG